MKQRQKTKLKKLEQKLTENKTFQFPENPTEFCTKNLNFKPTEYQQKLIQQFQKTSS